MRVRRKQAPAPAPADTGANPNELKSRADAIKADALAQREKDRAALKAKAAQRKAEEQRQAEAERARRLAAQEAREQQAREQAAQKHLAAMARARGRLRDAKEKCALVADSYPLYAQAKDLLAEMSAKCNAGKFFECWGSASSDFEAWAEQLKNGFDFLLAAYMDAERDADAALMEVRRLESEGMQV